MIHETVNLLSASLRLFTSSNPNDFEKIFSKDDYIDNLKNLIETECFSNFISEKALTKRDLNDIRALQTIAVNLERIADQSVNITKQLGYLENPDFINRFNYTQMFGTVLEGLESVMPIYEKRDLQGALDICKREPLTDRLYKQNFDKIMEMFADDHPNKDLVTTLFIFRYLERIGDLILNIGEALILAIVGEKIKIHQFLSMQSNLEQLGFDGSASDIDFQSILGSRSGCRISRLGQGKREVSKTKESIFKEGNTHKIRTEKESLETWNTLFPGLAPRVFSYQEGESTTSMLVEFIHGCPFDEILLNGEDESLNNALFVLMETSREVWLSTRKEEPIATDYMKQLQERFAHIRQVHPEFYRGEQDIGFTKVLDTGSLLQRCREIEKELPAPFSVRIHGDFNVNNLVFDPEEQMIHYIDLYRSRQADYIQDISVFLVSNFRIPIYEKILRDRLNQIIKDFYVNATLVAAEWHDSTFDARLTLALARSFYTSTRFEHNKVFAEEMYLRAHFLLDKLLLFANLGRPWQEFRMNTTVLYY
ncbi:MAG: phosphotransferase [Proteobacteria bacterium]|nr:phosphotransferase [Pseudomonadota bacterium]MBU1736830.1 phosphotransferase [Pseudomonadota bacterium]